MTQVARQWCCAAGRAGVSKAQASTSGQRPGVLVMTALQKIADEQANEISHMCRQVPMGTCCGVCHHFVNHQRIENGTMSPCLLLKRVFVGNKLLLQVQCR